MSVCVNTISKMTGKEGRCVGSFLCAAVADALGAKYEWQSHRQILQAFPNAGDIFSYTDIANDFFYSDDTQSSIAIAESLIKDDGIESQALIESLAKNYEPWRGYGTGFRKIMNAYAEGVSLPDLPYVYFTDGSYGNGAAMRVAPIAIRYSKDAQLRREHVEKSCVVTHAHADAIEGAQVLAAAIAYAYKCEQFNSMDFQKTVLEEACTVAYQEKLKCALSAESLDDLIELGSDISALDSVPTAIAAFHLHSDNYVDCIGAAIQIGGDTDTVASMAGNIFGALNGTAQIPVPMLDALERDNVQKGVTYMRDLCLQYMRGDYKERRSGEC